MRVSDIKGVRKTVMTVPSSRRLGEVARAMRVGNAGAMVVSSPADPVAGIITERDIVYAVGLGGPAAVNLSAGEVMTSPVPTCTPADFVPDIMNRMLTRRIRHVALVEGGQLVGMVSTGDVMKALLEGNELETNILRDLYLTAQAR
jgi:signal-transduction protein with cAMP-binding, CBS, and nucleotidyltransferase domain